MPKQKKIVPKVYAFVLKNNAVICCTKSESGAWEEPMYPKVIQHPQEGMILQFTPVLWLNSEMKVMPKINGSEILYNYVVGDDVAGIYHRTVENFKRLRSDIIIAKPGQMPPNPVDLNTFKKK